MAAAELPAPGFEGFEKRLEIEFSPTHSCGDKAFDRGLTLRNLSRSQLDELLKHAECTIVSQLHNERCDSYVLSESSLFVYPLKIVIKTCGTTQLLKAIPRLLELTSELHLKVIKCKYTRGTFMFPEVQPSPHSSFEEEVDYLERYFGYLGGEAYVMGDLTRFPNWHLFVASENQTAAADPTFTLEMCMTDLDQIKAHQFYNASGSLSGLQMTTISGIDTLLPKAEICDFAFKPCGYSMNALDGGAHSTIHVTPEDGMSYASFESMGYGPREMNLQELVNGVASVFKPGKLAMSVHMNSTNVGGEDPGSWGAPVAPAGYICVGTTRQELLHQGAVVFHMFELAPDTSVRRIPSAFVLPLIQKNSDECSKSKQCGDVFCACNVQLVKEITYRFNGREIMKVFAATNSMSTFNSEAAVDPYLHLRAVSSAGPETEAMGESEVCQYLLIAARSCGLKVIGAALQLHVGGGAAFDVACFAEIIESAANFFCTAATAGVSSALSLTDMELQVLNSKYRGDGRASSRLIPAVTSTMNQVIFLEDACALATRSGICTTHWASKSNDGIYSQ